MDHPWLSVIIPTYNGEAFLPRALDSIAVQGDNHIECILIDDGSTDSTFSILNAYKNKFPLEFLPRERQGNWVANTNYALARAKGEYVCFLHQDDFWFKDRLRIMKLMIGRYPEVVILLHSSEFIDSQGNHVGLWSCPLPHFPKVIESNIIIKRLLVQNFISIPGPIFKREIALEVGGLDENLWYTADWDFWLKIAARGNGVYYPRPLSGFRIHTNSQTVIRSYYLDDFQEQLKQAIQGHIFNWNAPESIKRKTLKIANFSIQANTALAGYMHNKKIPLIKLLLSFLKLGPLGQYEYLRDSRLWERASARLRAKL